MITEDWGNNWWKSSFATIGINYIWQNIKKEKNIKIVIIFHNITVFSVLLIKSMRLW